MSESKGSFWSFLKPNRKKDWEKIAQEEGEEPSLMGADEPTSAEDEPASWSEGSGAKEHPAPPTGSNEWDATPASVSHGFRIGPVVKRSPPPTQEKGPGQRGDDPDRSEGAATFRSNGPSAENQAQGYVAAFDRLSAHGIAAIALPSLRETSHRYQQRAQQLLQKEAWAQSVEYWRRYLQFCPEDAQGWYAQGDALVRQGLYEEAKEAFTEAHRKGNGMALASATLGWLCVQMQDYPAAIAHYEAATLAQPDELDFYHGLLEAYELSGDLVGSKRAKKIIEALEQNRTAHPALQREP